MKKINFIYLLAFSILLALNSSLFAQTDYEIVQSFKTKHQQIEEAIKNATSLDELDQISNQIDGFRQDFLNNKALLDKGLYPNNFDTSIESLRNALTLRRGDFTQIDVLKTEVTELQTQVDQLNTRNTELINQVTILEEQSKKDKSRISQLERSVAELKTSLRKRDDLVMNMLDSLMPAPYRGGRELTQQEKQEVYSEAQKTNIIGNIKRSIRDNIRFLEVTTLNPDDLSEIRRQQQEYARLWRSAGPKIIDIYSEKGENVNHLKEIDEAFNSWQAAINQQVWNSVREKFTSRGITISNFSNGKDFANSVTTFIDDEIKNADVKGKEEIENTYKSFDSTWYQEVKPDWIPYLVDNRMITEAQRDTIENRIEQWKAEVYPGGVNWLIIIIIVLVVVIIIIFFVRRKPKETKIETISEPPKQ